MKRALITGITGQDGSYLAEFLLGKPDYEVHGLVRRSSSLNRQRIDHIFWPATRPSRDRFHLHYADLADASSLSTLMEQVRPDEVYNLGAQSHVRVSFDQPLYTADVVGLGTLRLLEAVRQLNRSQPVKFYQASSSEMFGSAAAAAGARHAVPPPQPLRLRQALRPLADGQLPRGLRPVRLLGHPVQPREPPPRRVVRHPQDHPRRHPDQGRAPEEARHGQPRRQARLGLRRRLRPRHVADAPAGQARRLRRRHRRDPLGPRVPRARLLARSTSTTATSSSSTRKYTRPSEVDVLLGDPTKAQRSARLEARGRLPRASSR